MPSKKSKKTRKTLAVRLAEEREACARLAEEHVCSYDCWEEDVNGNSVRSGHCKWDIASEIRMGNS